MRNTQVTSHQMESPGIGPKKTFFVLMTVVGCIAILWPKVFYPMMVGGGIPKQPAIKGHHGTVSCCDVVLDRDKFMNMSLQLGELSYRKHADYHIAEMSLRQERPPHLRKEGIHPAMLEKGRAIPNTQTVPVVHRPAKSQPIMVEGRPGPIPGLRPPLGAGAVHKAQPKGNSMGFIMPLYTIGIIAFFVYTIMKLLFKKPITNSPYGPARGDPNFRKEVFGDDQLKIKRPDDGTTKLEPQKILGANHQQMHANCNCDQMHANGAISSSIPNKHHQQIQEAPPETVASVPPNTKVVREREQLMEIEKLRKKLEETEHAMAKLISEMGCDTYMTKDESQMSSSTPNIPNGHSTSTSSATLETITAENGTTNTTKDANNASLEEPTIEKSPKQLPEEINSKKHSEDKTAQSHKQTVQVLGMELTASCEGGQKWNRPPTPLFPPRPQSPIEQETEKAEAIFLEGALPKESKILVADAETTTEKVLDEDMIGSSDEPAVVLSSKMTLSLINLNAGDDAHNSTAENDSPIAEDIEIINGAEKECNDTDEIEEEEEENEDSEEAED